MFTLGYNKTHNSLFKQNLDPKFGLFQIPSPDDSDVLKHLDSVHFINVPSADISNRILSHQLQHNLTSDLISDGKFMKDFVISPVVVDKLGYGMLEGVAHHYFNEVKYLIVVDSNVSYTKFAKGRHVFIESYDDIRCYIGTPVGEVLPTSYVKFHSPAVIHRHNADVKPDKLDDLTEISPDVYQNNPLEIFDKYIDVEWTVNTKKDGLYKLDPDVLPSKGFVNYEEVAAIPVIKKMLDHMAQTNIHPGSWITAELSPKTTTSSGTLSVMYGKNTLQYRPSNGDWFVSPDNKSYSYKANLTDDKGHWLAYSTGDPNAKVTDPDDPSIVLGQCVNGTSEMRCYFTLDKDKFPEATPSVLLRRCNPIMGFTALTFDDISN